MSPFDTGPRRDSGPGRDAGPVAGDAGACMGDRLDMTVCATADSVCRYGETCPAAMFPPYDDCVPLLREQLGMARTTAPDLTTCIECLEALDRAFDRFAATGVCPPPADPPPDVVAECDTDTTFDSDGDGNPANDVDACGFE